MNPTISKRELHLQLVEIESTIDAFKFCYNLMFALRIESITSEQYEMFVNDFINHCKRNNIKVEL